MTNRKALVEVLTAASIALATLDASHVNLIAQDDSAKLLQEFTWRSIGPVNMGGRVDDIEAVENAPWIIYVGTASSGIWKTENHGTTWTPVFDGQPNLSIGDIAIAPSNPNIVWAGTGEANSRQSTTYGAGVFKSTDAGRTWTFVGLPNSGHIGRIVIDPKNPDIVYVAAAGDLFKPHPERGLFKTMDGGRNWVNTKPIDEDTGFIDVAMDPSNPLVLLAASYQRRRTAWGFNGGGPGSALWKTVDGAKTWKRVEGGGLPAYGQWGRTGLAFSRSRPNVVYALIEPGPSSPGAGADRGLDPTRNGVWRSEDKGTTWTLVSNENGRAMYFSQIRVDPRDPNVVFTMQRSLYRSTDGGRTFRALSEGILGRLQDPRDVPTIVQPPDRDAADGLPPSHPDHHAMWIDPANSRHILLGHDGGVDFSFDGGETWQLQNNMPMGQFYEVAVDMRQPYRVYGGLQDNGVWGGPSQVRNGGGITKDHWFELAAGDGYHVLADPTDVDIVYASVSGGGGQHTWRFNLRTGEQRYIRRTPPFKPAERNAVAVSPAGNIVPPLPANESLRFNWNPALAMSPHDPRTLYFGANRLFTSHDRGESWTATDDLTRALNRDTLAIMGVPGTSPMTSKHDGVSQWGTIVAVVESPVQPGLLWVGTDDGNVQLSRDGGRTWTNLAEKVATFSTPYYVESIEASHFEAGTAFVAFDGHHAGDFKPYLFKTTDFGATWTSIAGTLPARGHVNVIKEDRLNRDLLFVGTEFGFFVSLDGGRQWVPMMRNLPATTADDVLVHPRDQDLVLGTHGRSVYVLDDISPLQQLTSAVRNASEHLFRPRPAILWDEDKTSWHGASDDVYRGDNAAPALLAYYLKGDATQPVRVRVLDGTGDAVREWDAPRTAGLHRISWDLRRPLPETRGSAPANRVGERVLPGSYRVTLSVGDRALVQPLEVRSDPNR